MHLIKLGIPYSCTSIVAHLWASIAICKNSLKFFAWHENMTVAWDQAHFLYLFKAMLCITLQSILVSYAKIHFQQIYKLPKATKQISQITKKYSSPLNTLPCTILKQGGEKFSCDTGNMIYILIAWLGFLFFPPFCLSLILFIIKTIPLANSQTENIKWTSFLIAWILVAFPPLQKKKKKNCGHTSRVIWFNARSTNICSG